MQELQNRQRTDKSMPICLLIDIIINRIVLSKPLIRLKQVLLPLELVLRVFPQIFSKSNPLLVDIHTTLLLVLTLTVIRLQIIRKRC